MNNLLTAGFLTGAGIHATFMGSAIVRTAWNVGKIVHKFQSVN